MASIFSVPVMKVVPDTAKGAPAGGGNADDAGAASKTTMQPTFLSGSSLTFTIANTGGIAILTALGIFGMKITPVLVGVVAAILGIAVIAIGTNWSEFKSGNQTFQKVATQIVIGLLNVAILIAALWGSVVAIQQGLPVNTTGM